MNWWIVIPAAAIVIGAAATLIGVKRHERTREKIVMRVRTTELYGHIYPLLRRYDTENVESVTIRPQELSIRLMEPLGKCLRYTFRKHGLDQPEPEVLYALAQAAVVDMKVLRNRRHYTFQRHKDEHKNGQQYEWYTYTICPERKDEIIRIKARKRMETERRAAE